jgi:hypothetical protein
VTTALTTHYLCWTSLTSPDSRSFRPSGGPLGIRFLNWWIVLGKAANGWGHSQNYSPKKILVLRSIIPRYGFSMMVNCGYTMPSKYSMKFLGEHLGTYYTGRVWLARGCSINPTLQTQLFPLVLSKTHPTTSQSDPLQENPMGKCKKTR